MTPADARARAKSLGATDNDIAAEATRLKRQVGTVPFNNMIRALQMHPWRNTPAEWTRLAGALEARRG